MSAAAAVAVADIHEAAVRAAVDAGLRRGVGDKWLPSWLFYDAEGSRLFDAITELPEYYLTRAERGIFERDADAIIAAAARGSVAALKVVELGAGTAGKSQILLSAVVRRQGACLYVPIDVSASALAEAQARLAREEPMVSVRPLAVQHEAALPEVQKLGPRRLVLFIGSSIGNFDDDDAVALLRSVRACLAPGGALLLGADKKKDPARLLPAYDDSAGVTAAFNKRCLHQLNAVLGAGFDVDRFRHVAVWNEARSRIEMHLESVGEQAVCLGRAGGTVAFVDGERIHTESSHKYSDEKIRAILAQAGFALEQSFVDDDGLFGVHLARVPA